MPMIEPIPMDQLPERAREIIQGNSADSPDAKALYATPVPLQIMAYHSGIIDSLHAKRLAREGDSLLGGRIHELLRIRSAQLGECQPCMQSRKHDSISDDDVACLVGADRLALDDQERLAVAFLDLLSADHHAIDAETYRDLAEVFTTAQIIELGFSCAEVMGVHRFIHTLDIFGETSAAIPFSAEQVDARR